MLKLPDARALVAALADGASHPLERLATGLAGGESSLHGLIDGLRAAGLPIVVDQRRKVRLPWPLEMLDADAIARALPESARRLVGDIDVVWEVDSTSSELKRRADAVELGFLFAEVQSGGRGRRGRRWLSPPGLNVCVSCVKCLDGGVERAAGLSVAVGVMVVRALAAVGVGGVGLKWPNDLVVDGRKLGGILVELDGGAGAAGKAIIGVGINLRLPDAVRAAAGQPTVDVAEVAAAAALARNRFCAALAGELALGLTRFAGEGLAPFAAEFHACDVLAGRAIALESATEPRWTGVGAGIDARGALRVETARGIRVVDSAEVSVRRA